MGWEEERFIAQTARDGAAVPGYEDSARNDATGSVQLTEERRDELGDVLGDSRSGGKARRFDAHQVYDLREFAVGLDDEIGDAFAIAGHQFRAQTGVG